MTQEDFQFKVVYVDPGDGLIVGSKWQKREIPSMRLGGFVVFTWWPRDAALIDDILRYGLEDA